jgi:lambda family phage tail tape measure protein
MMIQAQIMKAVKAGAGAGGGGTGEFLSGLFGSAKGNVFSHGQSMTAYAKGGIVTKPTIFPMSNGTGLMGEAGPEAVMPLTRSANGKLGVQAEGSSEGRDINITLVDERSKVKTSKDEIVMVVANDYANNGIIRKTIKGVR